VLNYGIKLRVNIEIMCRSWICHLPASKT